MAWPSYTLTQIITLAQQRADMVNSDLFGTTELRQYVTDSVAALSDLLITVQGGRQWSLKLDLTFTASTTENGVEIHSGQMAASNFYKLLGVGLKWPRTGTTERIIWLDPLADGLDRVVKREDWASCPPRYMLSRNPGYTDMLAASVVQEFYLALFPLPNATWTVRVEYFPLFRFDNDAHTINFPFPEFVILDVAIKCATKEQNTELLAMLQSERGEVEKRIRNWATPIDRKQAGFLHDVREEIDMGDGYHGRRGWP